MDRRSTCCSRDVRHFTGDVDPWAEAVEDREWSNRYESGASVYLPDESRLSFSPESTNECRFRHPLPIANARHTGRCVSLLSLLYTFRMSTLFNARLVKHCSCERSQAFKIRILQHGLTLSLRVYYWLILLEAGWYISCLRYASRQRYEAANRTHRAFPKLYNVPERSDAVGSCTPPVSHCVPRQMHGDWAYLGLTD